MSGPVFITAGGTGGHMFPAMALAEELKARGQSVRFVTDGRGARYLGENLTFDVIHAGSPSGSIAKKLSGLWALAIGTLQSWLLIGRFKPIATTCFGGYASIPAAFASILRRVPILIHEQNAVFGRANRLVAGKASKIALAFENTSEVPANARSKLFVSGNPVRPGFGEHDLKLEPNDKIQVLVLGGSQGARILSDAVPGALAALPGELRARVRVAQQCRPEDLERVKDAYAQTDIETQLATFFDDVSERMADADLLISRAGASTIAELLITATPSILVPYALAADDHQHANAVQLKAGAAAEVVTEGELTAERLCAILQSVLAKSDQLEMMSEAARKLARPDAASALADGVMEIAGGRR